VQKATLAKFEKFLTDYPQADEAPEVLFQLATVNEFNGDEDKARVYYGRLAKDFAATDAGKKSLGAIRRLDSDGGRTA
jgi:TolA-binding protein